MVTPAAKKSSGCHFSGVCACTCMSTSPGVRNLPRPSMTVEPAGTGVVAAGPTSATRSASMMTVAGVSGGRPVPSIKVAQTTASFWLSGINRNCEYYQDVEGQTSTLTNRVIHTSA